MAVRVAINGFGRIGRTILRLLATTRAGADVQVVAVNDTAPLETCAYLFEFDLVFGPFPGTVAVTSAPWSSTAKRSRSPARGGRNTLTSKASICCWSAQVDPMALAAPRRCFGPERRRC